MVFALEHGELRLTKGFAATEAVFEPRIVFGHQFAGDAVANGPQAPRPLVSQE